MTDPSPPPHLQKHTQNRYESCTQLNPDLLSPQERARFRGLVGVLLSCGLTFAPQSASTPTPAAPAAFGAAAAGAQEFALEPAIDQVFV